MFYHESIKIRQFSSPLLGRHINTCLIPPKTVCHFQLTQIKGYSSWTKILFHLITIQSTSLIPPKTVCLTANTNQGVLKPPQNTVSSNYNTIHISDTPKTVCLTANTNQGVFQLDQNTVSSNYNTIHISDTTQNCLSLTANTIQGVQQLDQNTVSPNYNTIDINDPPQNCLSYS